LGHAHLNGVLHLLLDWELLGKWLDGDLLGKLLNGDLLGGLLAVSELLLLGVGHLDWLLAS